MLGIPTRHAEELWPVPSGVEPPKLNPDLSLGTSLRSSKSIVEARRRDGAPARAARSSWGARSWKAGQGELCGLLDASVAAHVLAERGIRRWSRLMHTYSSAALDDVVTLTEPSRATVRASLAGLACRGPMTFWPPREADNAAAGAAEGRARSNRRQPCEEHRGRDGTARGPGDPERTSLARQYPTRRAAGRGPVGRSKTAGATMLRTRAGDHWFDG